MPLVSIHCHEAGGMRHHALFRLRHDWQQRQQFSPKRIVGFVFLTTCRHIGDDHFAALPNRKPRKRLRIIPVCSEHSGPTTNRIRIVNLRDGKQRHGKLLIREDFHRDKFALRLISLPVVTAPPLNGQRAQIIWDTQPQATRLSQKNRIVRRGAKFAGQSFCFHKGSLAELSAENKARFEDQNLIRPYYRHLCCSDAGSNLSMRYKRQASSKPLCQ